MKTFDRRKFLEGTASIAAGTALGASTVWAPAVYAQSLAFVDYLRRTYGERLLFDLVAGCKQGRAPEETFRDTLGGVELALVQEDFAAGL